MAPTSWDAILLGLDNALTRCDALGIRPPGRARFGEHRRCITQLLNRVEGGSVERVTLAENIALSESEEFADVVDTLLDSETPDALRGRLAHAFDGPADTNDETSKNNFGRNIFFELYLTARLKKAGLHPVLLDDVPSEPIGHASSTPDLRDVRTNNI